MARLIFFGSLFLFLLVGVFCLIFLDVSNIKGSVVDTDNSNIDNTYDKYVIKDDFNIRNILSRISEDCLSGNFECITIKAYNYVVNDISLVKERNKGRNPKQLLTIKEADVYDKSVLLASFLENAGIKTHIEESNNKVIVYAKKLNLLKLYNEIIKDLHKKPLASREVVLKKNGVWVVNLNTSDNKPITIDISAKSEYPFSLMLFPNEKEMNNFLKYKNGRYMTDCFLDNVTIAELSCLSSSGGKLLFISKANNNKFSGKVFRGGILLSDVKSVEINKEILIPMDVSLNKPLIYPGMIN